MFSVGEKQSATHPVLCSVPGGSVLGPVQFFSYTEDTTTVFDKHGIKHHHMFADDKQLLTSVAVADVSAAKSNTEACAQMSKPGVHLADCSLIRLKHKSSGFERDLLQQLALARAEE